MAQRAPCTVSAPNLPAPAWLPAVRLPAQLPQRLWQQHSCLYTRQPPSWQGQQRPHWRAGSSSGGGSSAQPSTGLSSLTQLQAALEAAVDREDYEEAAQLRDELTRRREDARVAVEEANQKFYAAFTNNSIQEMRSIWGKGEHVQCIHPLTGCIATRESVLDSWRLVLGGGAPFSINVRDVRVYVSDTLAYVTCLEVVEADTTKGRISATNIFEKQEGRWVIVHHHGGPAAAQA